MPESSGSNESLQRIIEEIDAIRSVDDTETLTRLQELIDQFFACLNVTPHLEVWFRLFERFPEDDGYEMFWSILHGLEAQPGYEPFVVDSVRRKPSRFPLLMVNRMLNGGYTRVGETDLLELVCGVSTDQTCLPSMRNSAEDYLAHQRERGR